MFVEVCVDRVSSAKKAQEGGASRLELCDNLLDGGTTPSYGMIRTVLKNVTIPVNVIIRPRGGDFLYTEEEMDVMLSDIQVCKELGAHGVVIGCLTADGHVDKEKNKRLIEAARPLSVTFHRAIDMTVDLFQALEDCIELGVDRILTSGGRENIKNMVIQANSRVIIMAGGGVSEKNARELIEYTHINEIHGTARGYVESGMIYRKEGVFMGGEKKNTQELEFKWKETSKEVVQQIVNSH